MSAITTSKITLPKEVAQGIIEKAQDTSTIQTLSPSTPMLFKDISHILFTKEPEAEFVAEGGQKASTEAEFTPAPGEIHKAQVTVRMSDEVTAPRTRGDDPVPRMYRLPPAHCSPHARG